MKTTESDNFGYYNVIFDDREQCYGRYFHDFVCSELRENDFQYTHCEHFQNSKFHENYNFRKNIVDDGEFNGQVDIFNFFEFLKIENV